MEQEKRTPTKLLKAKVYREDMTFAEEKDFVKYMYKRYEKSGFKPVFEQKAPLPSNEEKYNGQPFEVVKACEIPKSEAEQENSEFMLMDLPAWIIQFRDGHQMMAYPEEITNLNTSGFAAC